MLFQIVVHQNFKHFCFNVQPSDFAVYSRLDMSLDFSIMAYIPAFILTSNNQTFQSVTGGGTTMVVNILTLLFHVQPSDFAVSWILINYLDF